MKRTHHQPVSYPRAAVWKGTRRSAMTYVEMIVALFISSIVALATFTLVSAYVHNATNDDLGEIQAESSLLYAYVQGWLQDGQIIAAASGPDYGGAITGFDDPPLMDEFEVAIGLIAIYLGPRTHQVGVEDVVDNVLQYDEIEALLWTLETTYTEGGANGSGGVLMRLYYDSNDTLYAPAAEDALCVPDDWLINAEKEFLSDSVVRMAWLPPSTGNCDPEAHLDVRFTLMDFSKVGAAGMPQRYSFQLVANTQAEGL